MNLEWFEIARCLGPAPKRASQGRVCVIVSRAEGDYSPRYSVRMGFQVEEEGEKPIFKPARFVPVTRLDELVDCLEEAESIIANDRKKEE